MSSTPSLPQREQDKSHSTTYATLSEGKLTIGGKQTTVQELGIHSTPATANQKVDDLPDLAKIIEKQQIVQGATADIQGAINTYTEQQRKEAQHAKQQAEQLYQQQLAQRQDDSLARYQALSSSEQEQELRNNSVAYQHAEQQYTSWSVGGDKNRALSTVSTIISSSLGGQGANQVVTQAVSPYTAYAIGQYFKHNEALNQRDLEQTGEKGTRAEQGSASHLLAHGLLAAATSYATGQSPASITTATITTMGAEALAPKLSQYLYGTEKVADLNTEQKQTISNVLGTVGLVAGAVTAQATGADSMSSVSAGQQVQDGVVNAIDNNWLSKEDINSLIKDYNQKIIDCEIQGQGNCSLEKKKLIMTEIMEQGREKSLQNNQILDDICKTNKSLCSEKIKNMKDSLAFSLNNLNSDLINDSYIKNFDNLNQNIQDLLSDNTPVSRIIIVQAEYDDKSRINEVTSLQDLNTYENLSSLMLYSDENTKETIYNYLRNRSFNGTNQKAETGRLWKDFSLWVSEKRDERLYDDYENINSVPNLIANSTLQTTELTKMSGKNRGINIIKGAGDAGISVVVKTGEWITNIPDILKEQVNTITNTDYVEAVSDIAKNHTFKEDVKKLYTNAVDATTNLFEDADKMFTSDKNSEVIPASQNATEFTAGVIGAFIPVNKATKAINITKAPDKTPTSSSDTPSKTEHKSQNSFDKEKVLANLENNKKARDSSNFNDYTNSENVRRIEYDSKLTTTVDGNLSVTHGLGYNAKKELDGIRAFLVENKTDPNQISYINNSGNTSGDPNKLSIATATVTNTDGTKTHYLAVSGKSWSGHAPTSVTINGKDYKVITNEAYTGKMINGKPEKVLPDRLNPDNNQYNANHAEKKLMSHITQQNQHGDISDVQINIQNTSRDNQGACYGCGGQDGMGGTIEDFKNLNQNLKIHIEHGSTKTNK